MTFLVRKLLCSSCKKEKKALPVKAETDDQIWVMQGVQAVLEERWWSVNVCTMNNELLNLANWERQKEKFKMFMTFLFTSLLFNFL